MSIQFISCNAEECPLNEDKQCRAPWIVADESGKCLIRANGPYDGKSETEKYVDLMECRCEQCRHWERDQSTLLGQCGLGTDLFFNLKWVENPADPENPTPVGPVCNDYDKQISEPPPYSATLDL